MTITKDRRFQGIERAACLLAALLFCSCQPCRPLWGPGYPDCEANASKCEGCADKAEVCAKPTVEALAHDLDDLEEQIEKYGSVVAKHPDVWGQARLTRHREEFETQMAAQLGNFDFTLQGSVSMSDQAYFADAAALSAAAAPTPRRAVSSSSTVSSGTAAPPQQPSPQPPPQPSPPPAPQPLPLPNQSDTFAAFANISRTPVRNGPALEFAGAKTGITVEPTVLLDQRARYLNHLHELRRINEGDDTADSPGYALNLVRIPVSVLPGKCTDVGCGAEVTMTLTPYLNGELLPTTFRNLVLNDLVDHLGLPATVFLNNPDNSVLFSERNEGDMHEFFNYTESHSVEQMLHAPEELKRLRYKLNLQPFFALPKLAWVDELLKDAELDANLGWLMGAEEYGYRGKVQNEEAHQQVEKMKTDPVMKAREQMVKAEISRTLSVHTLLSFPATKTHRALLPFPLSQIDQIYGADFLYHIIMSIFHVVGTGKSSRPCVDSEHRFIHLPDVQSHLQEQLAAAYNFLADPENIDLWQFCTRELATAIHSHQGDRICAIRQGFKKLVQTKTMSEAEQHTTNTALAWAIIVESALLTDQLIQDMREEIVSKGCACGPIGDWLPYFHPNPPAEARQAFNEYVRCRWPVHVFALDPVTEEQNLADTFSGRREMQLAMSLAFVSGQISASNMMRYARRIEFDFATIDLNGTAVGFSHGDETFGWRFYPRFQTPDIESNFTVFFRDLLYGGPNRNALLRQRRIEPGMRECVAVVMMPSFVPYATMNVSSNWFKLTNPKCKEMDASYAMKLSQAVKSIENCAGRVSDGDCYRAGDLERLFQKAKQLETRLPLQSTKVQIPYENTLGGFAMFNTGITDLAPELLGWYGSPSINPKEPTTLFLVGKHFSVHQTRVIAGGQFITSQEMLSREVIKVVIPPNPVLMGDACQKFVDVHIATPYGVTQHLPIPICNPPPDPTVADAQAAKGLAWKSATVSLAFAYGGVGIVQPSTAAISNITPPNVVIQPGNVDTQRYPYIDVTLKFDKRYGDSSTVPIPNVAYDPAQKGYTIAGGDFATAIFTAFGSKFGPETSNPPCALVTTTTTVTLKVSQTAAPAPGSPASTTPTNKLEKPTTNKLTIQWIKAPAAPAKSGS